VLLRAFFNAESVMEWFLNIQDVTFQPATLAKPLAWKRGPDPA
jgi:hypothetical protein